MINHKKIKPPFIQMMPSNLAILLQFLEKAKTKIVLKKSRGRKPIYSTSSMILFFMVMMLKKIYTFKTMETYAKQYYQYFGWQKAPSRKTIRTRFEKLSADLENVVSSVALACMDLSLSCFSFKVCFVDKSVFCSKGGIWHRKHQKEELVPHPSIDTAECRPAASWAKSQYHGWRFGYGLHSGDEPLIVNELRFPMSSSVTTASVKDYTQVNKLIHYLHQKIGLIVGYKGCFCLKVIKNLDKNQSIFLLTNKLFKIGKDIFKTYYNQLATTVQAIYTYRLRKESIDPTFALIKELFDLTGDKKLPYKGIDKVSSFLMLTVVTVQLMMYLNFIHQLNLGDTTLFRTSFK